MKKTLSPILLWIFCIGLWVTTIVDMSECGDTALVVQVGRNQKKINNGMEGDDTQEKSVITQQSKKDMESCVDINRALPDELTALPGIGPVIAGRIVTYRSEHGPFTRLEEIDQVKGIGPVKLKKLADKVCF